MPRRRVCLLLMLATALILRVWGIGFGFPYANARPDETQIAGPAVGYLSGDLRPPFFQWPTLFQYTVAAGYVGYFAVTRPFAGYQTLAEFAETRRQHIEPFLYISRSLAAVFGVLTVWGIYAIGRRAFDDTVALVAGLFLACAFLHVRDSHFGVADVPMTAMVVLAVLATIRWRDSGPPRAAVMAGVLAGVAASIKYNGLGAAVPFAVALTQRTFEMRHDSFRVSTRAPAAALAFGVALAAAFFGGSPYILIDWPRFLADTQQTLTMMAAGHGMSLGRGWWYYARTVLPAAIGWPMFLAGAAGIFGALLARFRSAAVVFAFPLAYYLVAGAGYGVFARYIVPVIPFLCLAAAWLIVTCVRAIAQRMAIAYPVGVIAALGLLVVAPTAYKSLRLDYLLTRTDNRVVVARTVIDVVSAGDVLYQTGEPYGHIPLELDGRRAMVRSAGFNAEAHRFSPRDPDWIVVQRSPLALYSGLHPAIEEVLNQRYVLARKFPVESAPRHRLYDQQDAFFLPLDGLEDLLRPGPEFELYSRRQR